METVGEYRRFGPYPCGPPDWNWSIQHCSNYQFDRFRVWYLLWYPPISISNYVNFGGKDSFQNLIMVWFFYKNDRLIWLRLSVMSQAETIIIPEQNSKLYQWEIREENSTIFMAKFQGSGFPFQSLNQIIKVCSVFS